MFSIFKSKPQLKELIYSGYTDIHNHVLPGIDDGAKNITDSKFLIEAMRNMGFNKIIATPHSMSEVWENTPFTIESSFNQLKNENCTNTTNLFYASEYFLNEEMVNWAKNKNVLTLKDNYLLVELSYLNAPFQLRDFIFDIQLSGYTIVLAHPERYVYFHNSMKEYEELKKMGVKFQLNVLSTVGYYGKSVANAAQNLLNANLIDYTGSDIHHKHHINSFSKKIMVNTITQLEQAINNNTFFQ